MLRTKGAVEKALTAIIVAMHSPAMPAPEQVYCRITFWNVVLQYVIETLERPTHLVGDSHPIIRAECHQFLGVRVPVKFASVLAARDPIFLLPGFISRSVMADFVYDFLRYLGFRQWPRVDEACTKHRTCCAIGNTPWTHDFKPRLAIRAGVVNISPHISTALTRLVAWNNRSCG